MNPTTAAPTITTKALSATDLNRLKELMSNKDENTIRTLNERGYNDKTPFDYLDYDTVS